MVDLVEISETRIFADISGHLACLNQDLPDAGIFRMRPPLG